VRQTTAKLARPPFDSLRTVLPAPLQPWVPTFSTLPNTGGVLHALLHDPSRIVDAFRRDPTTVLATVLLPLLVVGLAAFGVPGLMAWRSYVGGRYSPFTSTAPRSPPQVTESDYHYIGPDDIVDPPREYRGATNQGPPLDDASQPDILILRHRGTTYPLHFPAYVIGEGILRVGELRRYAAEKTGTADPRRIKLLYKGKQLKDDAVACREEGLKQNSELMCVVSETPVTRAGSSDESESASDSDFRTARTGRSRSTAGIDAPRVNVDGTIINDSPRRKHKTERTSSRKHKDEDGYLHPTGTPVGEPKSASRPTTPASSTTAPPPPPKPQPSPGPKTPIDQLAAIGDTFRTTWVPVTEKFIANPPADQKARTQEYTRLSECILAQIIFKLDGVDTEGDADARAMRKGIIKETQALLGRLDAVGKPGGKSPT
jgi:BAG domain